MKYLNYFVARNQTAWQILTNQNNYMETSTKTTLPVPFQRLVQRSFCLYCDLLEANQEDWDTIPEGEGTHLCWGDCAKDAEYSLRRVIAERNTFRETLEYIASANISARHCQDEARKSLGISSANASVLAPASEKTPTTKTNV